MDYFFKNWFQRREATGGTQAVPGVPSTTDPNDASNQQPKGANWEANVVRPYGRQSLLLPTWNRCVTIIMETMGQTLIQYQRMDSEGGNFTEDRGYLDRRRTIPTDGNRLNYLLQVLPTLAISFLASYMAIWLELFEGYTDTLYTKLYGKIYPTTDTPDTDA